MNKSKIEWCDMTWNPVTGCLHGCPYCYARSIANRFSGFEIRCGGENVPDDCKTNGKNSIWSNTHGKPLHVFDEPAKKRTKSGKFIAAPYPYNFEPTFHKYRLDEPSKMKKPQTIFVCSMADLFGEWVPDNWIMQVFEACKAAPQHRYMFLTKNPKRMTELASNDKLPKHDNFWYGSTVTTKDDVRFPGNGITYNTFLSIEPLLEPLAVGLGSFGGDGLIIIGAESGNRKERVVPKREWIENIVTACELTGASVFMKDSLQDIWGEPQMRELPWEG